MSPRADIIRTCRGCGCTDRRACPGGCAWVLLDIKTPTGVCSACAEELAWHPLAMANVFGEFYPGDPDDFGDRIDEVLQP